MAQVSLVRVISCSSHYERVSSTLSPPFRSTSSSSQAFVDPGAVDNVLPKSVCTESLEATSKSQSGVGFKDANGSHIKHFGQRRFGSNMNTIWEVADVHKPLTSASRLLERGHKLVLVEKPRIQCKNGDNSAWEDRWLVRRTVVDSEGRVFTGRAEHQLYQEKKACKTAH